MGYSRELRKNMTDAERFLWLKVRMRQINGYQFYRQRIIGDYIIDFFCPKLKLVIELDGGQHYSGKKVDLDRKRDNALRKLGLKVLKFSDFDVLQNIDGVVATIIENICSENPP